MDADRLTPAAPPPKPATPAQLDLVSDPSPKPLPLSGGMMPVANHDNIVAADFVNARSAAATPDWQADLARMSGQPVGPAATEAAAQSAEKKPAEPPAPSKPWGWKIVDGAKAVAKDIAGGLVSSPKHVVAGLLDAVNNMNDLIADATAKVPGPYLQVFNAQGGFEPRVMSEGEGRAQQLADREARAKGAAHGITYNVEHPDTVTGDIIRTAVSFLAARRAIAGNPTTAAGNAAADVAAGAASMGPSQPRLSNIVEQVAPNFVTDFLQAKPEDEGTMLGHLKAGLEMGGLGQLFSATAKGVKALKQVFTDDPALAEKLLKPALADGDAMAAAGQPAATGKTGTAALSEMADDLPWKPGAPGGPPAPGATSGEAAASENAKGGGGIAAPPDQAAQQFLALGDVKAPVVERPVVNVAEHAGAGEKVLADLKAGTPAPSIEGYVAGEGANPVKVNLARIGSPDDIKDMLARVSATIPAQEAQSNAATTAAADALGLSPTEFLNGYKGQNLNAAETTAMRFTLDSSAAQLIEYAKAAVNPETATPEAKALFMKAFATHRALQQYMENARAEAGRTLQAWSIMSQQRGNAAKAIQDLIESAGSKDVDRMAQALADIGDPVKAGRLVAASMRDSGRDNFLKFMYNVQLSNPRTVVKKLTSDAMMATWNVVTRYAAEMMPGSSVEAGEAADLAYGYYSSFRDALRYAGEALKKGESQFFQDYQTMDGLHSERMGIMADGAPPAFGNGEPTRAWQDYLRSALPTSWIGAADDFAKVMNYRAELRALARRASAGAEDPETAMAQMMDNVPLDLHKQAVAAALRNTFQEPLGAVGEKIGALADSLNLPLPYTRFEVPIGRILMPYIRTPLNIAKWSYTNSPLALAFPSDAIKAELGKGGAVRDLAIAKIGMGSALSASMAYLAFSNRVTGGGPSDPQLQRAWRAAGNEPYSVRIGEKWYGYNMVEPMGLMMSTIADTFTIARFAKEEDQEQMAASLAFGVGKAMLSKTYLQGIAQFFQALESPDQHTADYSDHLMAPFVTPQGVAGLAQSLDPFVRAHRGLLQTIEARLPYVSQGLPPQRTLWGDPVTAKEGFMPLLSGTTVANMISPIQTRDANAEPIDKWIWDNRMAFPRSYDNKTGLSKIPLTVSFAAGRGVDTQVTLTPEQHDRLQVLAGNGLKDPRTGLGAKDTLNGLVEGKGPAGLQNQWDRATDAERALIVQTVVNKFRSAAKEQVKNEFPDLKEAVDAGFAARAEALTH